MENKKGGLPKFYRKPRKVMWAIFYHGSGSTDPTCDMQAVWNTRKDALSAISRHSDSSSYTVEKYVRA